MQPSVRIDRNFRQNKMNYNLNGALMSFLFPPEGKRQQSLNLYAGRPLTAVLRTTYKRLEETRDRLEIYNF
jgi:hypothetical protein